MKKNISIREMLLFGFLLIAIVYYFFVQGPIAKESQNLNMNIEELTTQIEISQNRLVHMNNMQKALDDAFAENGRTPAEIPDYDNLNSVITELNALLSDTDEYSVSFDDDVISEDGIARRLFNVSYTVKEYSQAKDIIKALEESSNRYLVQNQTMDMNLNGETPVYTVSLSVICYEYVR